MNASFCVEKYITSFSVLAPKENWIKIEKKGTSVLEFARTQEDFAQIYARLSNATFHLKKYDAARMHATNCLIAIDIIQKKQNNILQLPLPTQTQIAFQNQNRDLYSLAKYVNAVFAACDEMEKNTRQ